jgi:hypothetical protein
LGFFSLAPQMKNTTSDLRQLAVSFSLVLSEMEIL